MNVFSQKIFTHSKRQTSLQDVLISFARSVQTDRRKLETMVPSFMSILRGLV